MSLTTHSRNTLEIANVSTQDDFFDNDDTGEGYTLSNATVQIVSLNDNLYLDGRTVVSDGNLSIGTSASDTYLILGSASTPALKIDSSQRIDLVLKH